MEENKILERHTPGRVSLGIKLKRVVWNVTAALLFRPFITPVFRKWRLLLLRMFGAEVEWDANVDMFKVFDCVKIRRFLCASQNNIYICSLS